MARRPGPARPAPLSGKAPPRFTAPFAITWRQVFVVWLMGSLILVGASWRLAPKATVDAGHTAWHTSRVVWSYGLLYANRYWPSWMPLAVPRPHHWPGYNRQLPWPGDARRLPWPSPGPMATPKPKAPTPAAGHR